MGNQPNQPKILRPRLQYLLGPLGGRGPLLNTSALNEWSFTCSNISQSKNDSVIKVLLSYCANTYFPTIKISASLPCSGSNCFFCEMTVHQVLHPSALQQACTSYFQLMDSVSLSVRQRKSKLCLVSLLQRSVFSEWGWVVELIHQWGKLAERHWNCFVFQLLLDVIMNRIPTFKSEFRE